VGCEAMQWIHLEMSVFWVVAPRCLVEVNFYQTTRWQPSSYSPSWKSEISLSSLGFILVFRVSVYPPRDRDCVFLLNVSNQIQELGVTMQTTEIHYSTFVKFWFELSSGMGRYILRLICCTKNIHYMILLCIEELTHDFSVLRREEGWHRLGCLQ
jgi:hypothetical protein